MKLAPFILLAVIAFFNQRLLAQEKLPTNSVIPMESAAVSNEEALNSPYFVDELHCEGFVMDENTSSWNDEESKQAQLKALTKQFCENLFKSFKVEKYSWQSAEDLETVQTALKASQIFESAELSLKKSELKNHVHLFLKVQPKKSSQTFSLDLYSSSTGSFSKIDYVYQSQKNAPFRISKMGISQFSILDGKIDETGINGEEKVAKLDLKENTIVNPFWEISSVGSIDSRLRMNIFGRNYRTLREESFYDFEMEGDFLNKNRIGISGTQYFGLAYHYFGAHSLAEIYDEKLRDKAGNVSTIAPGLRLGFNSGDAHGRFFNVDVVAYRVSTDSYYLKSQFDIGFKLNESIFGEQLKLGLLTEKFKNYKSAVGRSSIDDRSLTTLSLQMAKRMGSTKYADLLTYGYEDRSITAQSPEFKVEGTRQAYAKVGYQTSLENWDINLGLNVGL